MNSLQVLQNHEQKFPDSCVPWGLEFILKVHDKITLGEYPFQTAHQSRLGFGREADDLLRPHGILKEDKEFELADFQQTVEAELQAGHSPIFSIPVRFVLDMLLLQVVPETFHIFAAVRCNGTVAYLSRAHTTHVLLQIRSIHEAFRSIRKVKTDYKIHCLFYTVK